MAPPLYSSFTLFTELIVTAAILYVLHQGYHQGVFHRKIAGFAIGYEILFNISYMVYRTVSHPTGRVHAGWEIALAAFHGILSLVMFIALLVYLIFAWRAYGRGENYFKRHRVLTILFLILWLMAILSGAAFYVVEYF